VRSPARRNFLSRTLGKRPWAVVLDLSGLWVMDVEVVPALVDLANQVGEADIGFYLVAADDVVPFALAATGVEHIFDVHRDIDGALNALSLLPTVQRGPS
jgi:anti-anti-sigma factor